MGEAQSFLGKAIEVGCVSVFAAITSEIAVAEVISQDDDEASLLSPCRQAKANPQDQAMNDGEGLSLIMGRIDLSPQMQGRQG